MNSTMPSQEPTKIFYDAECGFCRAATGLVLAWDRRGRLRPVPLQDPAAAGLLGGLTELERMASAHLVTPRGERSSGGDAIAPLLDQLPRGARLAALSRRFPGQCRGAYAFVAARRNQLIKVVPAAARRAADRTIERRGGSSGATVCTRSPDQGDEHGEQHRQ
jgi:predicted DCC family thiol-disulfide oxidoreductase YuxK